jgi:hypothetical protein
VSVVVDVRFEVVLVSGIALNVRMLGLRVVVLVQVHRTSVLDLAVIRTVHAVCNVHVLVFVHYRRVIVLIKRFLRLLRPTLSDRRGLFLSARHPPSSFSPQPR